MRTLKLNLDNLNETLTWRHKSGELAKQTAVIQVIYDLMENKYVKYTDTQRNNIRLVLDKSNELIGENKAVLTPLEQQQAKVWSMFGPGFNILPSFATNQPADFYIDSRVGGQMAAPKREIFKEVKKLKDMATETGFDPHGLPSLPSFHHCGIW